MNLDGEGGYMVTSFLLIRSMAGLWMINKSFVFNRTRAQGILSKNVVYEKRQWCTVASSNLQTNLRNTDEKKDDRI